MSAIFLSIFGFGKKTSRRNRKITPKGRKIGVRKLPGTRRYSNTIIDLSTASNLSAAKYRGQLLVSPLKQPMTLRGFIENVDVPDVAEYHDPFELEWENKNTEEQVEFSRELLKIRNEIKEQIHTALMNSTEENRENVSEIENVDLPDERGDEKDELRDEIFGIRNEIKNQIHTALRTFSNECSKTSLQKEKKEN